MIHTCLVCGSSSTKAIKEFAHRKNETLKLVQCKNCECEFLSPQPGDEWLAEEYTNYFDRRVVSTENPKIVHFQQLLKKLNLNLEGSRILEMGSGEGYFIRALTSLNQSMQIHAVEGNRENAKYIEGLNCTFYNQSIEDWLASHSGERFDYVFLFDLIQHLRDPKQVLDRICNHNLADQGTVIATIPNSDAFSRKVMGPFWPQYKVKHLYYFSKNSLQRITEELNMSILVAAPLKKVIPIEYFLKIGKNLGSALPKRVFELMHGTCPKWLGEKLLPLYTGEWLWVIKKK